MHQKNIKHSLFYSFMSGHSKWHSIRHKKAANDAKRGKVLTKHAKLLAVIGRNDPNPETNPTLRVAIANAKADGVPKDNIERILKKISGDGKDGVVYTEVVYEGYAAGGIPFIVTALTDNVNRTFPQVRTAVEKSGGNLGAEGSVKFLFDHVGIVVIKTANRSEEELFEMVIEAGGDDFSYDEDESIVTTQFTTLGSVRDTLTEAGLEVIKSEPVYQSKDPQTITDTEKISKLEAFAAKVEEIDDVDEIFIGYESA